MHRFTNKTDLTLNLSVRITLCELLNKTKKVLSDYIKTHLNELISLHR